MEIWFPRSEILLKIKPVNSKTCHCSKLIQNLTSLHLLWDWPHDLTHTPPSPSRLNEFVVCGSKTIDSRFTPKSWPHTKITPRRGCLCSDICVIRSAGCGAGGWCEKKSGFQAHLVCFFVCSQRTWNCRCGVCWCGDWLPLSHNQNFGKSKRR